MGSLSRLHGKVEIMETKYLSRSIKLRIRANRSDIYKLQKSLNGNYKIKKDTVG